MIDTVEVAYECEPPIAIASPRPKSVSAGGEQSLQAVSIAKKRKQVELTDMLSEVNSTFNKYVESAMAKEMVDGGHVSGFTAVATTSLSAMGKKKNAYHYGADDGPARCRVPVR